MAKMLAMRAVVMLSAVAVGHILGHGNSNNSGIYVVITGGKNMISKIKKFIKDEGGMGVVEVILIIVVLISLVLIFKNQEIYIKETYIPS